MKENIFENCEDKTNDTSCWTCKHFYSCEKVINYFKADNTKFDENKFRALAKTEKASAGGS